MKSETNTLELKSAEKAIHSICTILCPVFRIRMKVEKKLLNNKSEADIFDKPSELFMIKNGYTHSISMDKMTFRKDPE